MISFPVVTAHGLDHLNRKSPTHVGLFDFQEWVARCDENDVEFRSLKNNFQLPVDLPPSTSCSRPLYFTCDDALASVLEMASIMQRPGTVFAVTGYVGKCNQWPGQPSWVKRENCLAWSDLRDLTSAGWTIGAHSVTHPDFNRLDDRSIRREIESSVKTIEDKTGSACRHFAWPYGNVPAHGRNILREMRLNGYGTTPGWVETESDSASLPRIDLYDLAGDGRFVKLGWKSPSQLDLLHLKTRRIAGRYYQSLRRSA